MQARLTDLPDMHPNLLWDSIIAATAAVFAERQRQDTYVLGASIENVPNFGGAETDLRIQFRGIIEDDIGKARRTYDAHRLVELSAIAIAGLLLFKAGGHRIRDIALRGSSADYLVDDENHLLEVAGRSRRADFSSAWENRRTRLSDKHADSYYLCVAEFETPRCRLAFSNREMETT